MSTMLRSLLRDRKPPMLMEGKPDGSMHIHWPEELKTVKIQILDEKNNTIDLGAWLLATKGGMDDWEKNYYQVSSMIMLANSHGSVTTESSNRWDAAFFLGIMWDRFRRKRGAKVEAVEITHTADQMDAIVKKFNET